MAETHIFTKREEIANAITHGVGTLLSIAALTLLIVYSSLYGTAWHVVTFTIYGASMLLLYISSTMVHSFPPGKAKDVFEIMDHAAIYVFIAGTYTPIALILVGGGLGWTLFGIAWGFAIGGVIFKIFFVKKILVHINNDLLINGMACIACNRADFSFTFNYGYLVFTHWWYLLLSWYDFLYVERISLSSCGMAFVCYSRLGFPFLFNPPSCVTSRFVMK